MAAFKELVFPDGEAEDTGPAPAKRARRDPADVDMKQLAAGQKVGTCTEIPSTGEDIGEQRYSVHSSAQPPQGTDLHLEPTHWTSHYVRNTPGPGWYQPPRTEFYQGVCLGVGKSYAVR